MSSESNILALHDSLAFIKQYGIWISGKKREPNLHKIISMIWGLEVGSLLSQFHCVKPARPLT